MHPWGRGFLIQKEKTQTVLTRPNMRADEDGTNRRRLDADRGGPGANQRPLTSTFFANEKMSERLLDEEKKTNLSAARGMRLVCGGGAFRWDPACYHGRGVLWGLCFFFLFGSDLGKLAKPPQIFFFALKYSVLKSISYTSWRTCTGGVHRTMVCRPVRKLAKPSYQTVLERVLGIRNQSSPVL